MSSNILEDPGARLPRSKLLAEMRCSEEQLPAGRRVGEVWTASCLVVGSNRNKAKKEKRGAKNGKVLSGAGFALLCCAVLCCAWLCASAPMLGLVQARPAVTLPPAPGRLHGLGTLPRNPGREVPPQSPGSAGFKPGVPTGGLTFISLPCLPPNTWTLGAASDVSTSKNVSA